MNGEGKDTKEKILIAASRLFAISGFDGTSIRDIASEADVNIAAVNYHFKNKQNLYWEIYELAQRRLEEDMILLAAKNLSVEDFIVEVFDTMLRNADMLRNTFKLILSDSFPEPDGQYQVMCSDSQRIGPPGGEILYQVIDKEVGESVPSTAKIWAVRVLFSTTAHWALMHSTSYLQKLCKNNPEMSPEKTRKLLRLAAISTMSFVKSSKGHF